MPHTNRIGKTISDKNLLLRDKLYIQYIYTCQALELQISDMEI
jgi:hypothetical protein